MRDDSQSRFGYHDIKKFHRLLKAVLLAMDEWGYDDIVVIRFFIAAVLRTMRNSK